MVEGPTFNYDSNSKVLTVYVPEELTNPEQIEKDKERIRHHIENYLATFGVKYSREQIAYSFMDRKMIITMPLGSVIGKLEEAIVSTTHVEGRIDDVIAQVIFGQIFYNRVFYNQRPDG
jgi:hypothetical protein